MAQRMPGVGMLGKVPACWIRENRSDIERGGSNRDVLVGMKILTGEVWAGFLKEAGL